MFVIAFDLDTALADRHHPKRSRQAYRDIEKVLVTHGFERAQYSVFVAKDEKLEKLVRTVLALRSLFWFGKVVRSVRAFRMEAGTDLTAIFTESST
jgi:virulence-associated protein VapD